MKEIGILGGGQLAQMLVQAAKKHALEAYVFVSSGDDPAAQETSKIFIGKLNSEFDLRQFFSRAKTIIFENEFIDCDLMRRAADGLDVEFIPSLGVIQKLQDKYTQKTLLNQLGIATSPYQIVPPDQDFNDLSHEWVLKWSRLGYDGKGTLILNENNPQEMQVFCQQAFDKGIPVYAEKKVDFKRELAITAVYSTLGDFQTYPLVVTEQKNGICKTVQGPAIGLGIDQGFEKLAIEYAHRLAKNLSLFGCFTIEMFQTQADELCVNELAPRVHNSCHYSQDAADVSQFENHLNAILGKKINSIQYKSGFAMVNLIGPKNINKNNFIPDLHMPINTFLHWYGKKECKQGRKLGHLNGWINDVSEVNTLCDQLKNLDEEWMRKVNDL